MILTILKVGIPPEPLRSRFENYPDMFGAMFDAAGAQFGIEVVDVIGGHSLPDPATLEAALVTGSSFGVYDSEPWIGELRDFLRRAYARNLPLVGICYGHQAIADALGGVVRKSEKGWGLGRHTYAVSGLDDVLPDRQTVAVTCSHQDQVLEPPADARVVLASEFAPNAGLRYANGRTLSFQPHPEFDDDYGLALAELRRGRAPDATVDTAVASFATPSDRVILATAIARFLERAMADRAAA